MKKIFFCALILIISFHNTAFAAISSSGYYQVVKPQDDIRTMYEDEQYDDIIDMYAKRPRNLLAEEQAYVALSYFKIGDIKNAAVFSDMAVKKDSRCALAFYANGMVKTSQGDNAQAISNFSKAVSLSSDNGDYYLALGDAYYATENYNKALENYRKATTVANPSERGHYMIAAIYVIQDDVKNAEEAFYVAKSKTTQDKELYVTLLYNIGNMEYDAKNYDKAINAYKELTEYFPDDYYSHEKLVQSHYALDRHDEAELYKDKLYDAYKQGELISTSLSDMFCIDEFMINDKYVVAYERYDDFKTKAHTKHIFYISNSQGDIESSVHWEYIPDIETGKGRYDLVMDKNGKRYNCGISYNDKITYKLLKPNIADIVNGKVEPKLID